MNKKAINIVRQSLPQRDIDLLMAERITPETDLPPMQPLFTLFDTPCFYRCELVADCGKAKSGKTTFLSVLMASALRGDCLELTRCGDQPLRVLWIDTEQSQQSTQEILRDRIAPLLGEAWTGDLNEHLYAFNLRGLGYEARKRMVEVAVMTLKPELVIIDGIKDLMTDINDAEQATILMEQLMALAKDGKCCIVCVLHQNKSEADRNMRGSIGTELTNKAFEVFQCEFADRQEVFKVSHTYSRKRKMQQKLYYTLNEEGLPEACDALPERLRNDLGRFTSAEEPSDNLRELLSKAMEGRTQRRFNELMAVALKKCGVADKQAYYALLKEAEEQGLIRKVEHPDTKQTWVELTDEGQLPF